MNIMVQTISEYSCNLHACFNVMHFHIVLYNSCWIKSNDGAIAAFIAPIVAIMLVGSS